MAVPTSITDCNATAANNSPAGSDSIGTSLDDYLRAHAAIIRQVSDDTIHLAGGTVTGQIKGITPVAAADLARKDYVDTMLPKAGGTVTGQIKGITPVAAEDLTRKDYVDSVVSAVNTSSGTYSPTVTAGTNTSAPGLSDNKPWLYTRVGSVVTVSGAFYADCSASATYSTVSITLPVTAAGDDNQLTGSGATQTNSGVQPASVVGTGGSPPNAAFVRFISYAAGSNNFVGVNFSYKVA